MSQGQYSFEAQCSLHCLTTLAAASTNQAYQSMLEHHGTKSPLGLLGQSSFKSTKALVHFQNLQGMYRLQGGPNVTEFRPYFDKKKGDGRHLSRLVVCKSWTALRRAQMPLSAVRLGALGVIVRVVLFMSLSMASCRQVHTISCFDACQWARNSREGPGEFQHLYGVQLNSRGHVARLQQARA